MGDKLSLSWSGKGQGNLKLSGNGNECKPLADGARRGGASIKTLTLAPGVAARAYTRPLFSSS